MTTDEIAEYYADLLILQYRDRPKARAEIKSLVLPYIMDQLPLAVQNAFNISDAVGVQLDIIGKYVGVTRYGYKFGATTLLPPVAITLDDTQFRAYIILSIQRNKITSSLYDVEKILEDSFPGAFYVYDYKSMYINYVYRLNLGVNILAEFFILAGALPSPMGVGVGSITYNPGMATLFFGFQTYSDKFTNHGLNKYTAFDANCPFLEYTNVL
jgi:hypothetical protein